MAFFVAMEEKIALPPFWGAFGETGVTGKIISARSRVQPGLARLASFYSITVPLVLVFPVFAMFAMYNDG